MHMASNMSDEKTVDSGEGDRLREAYRSLDAHELMLDDEETESVRSEMDSPVSTGDNESHEEEVESLKGEDEPNNRKDKERRNKRKKGKSKRKHKEKEIVNHMMKVLSKRASRLPHILHDRDTSPSVGKSMNKRSRETSPSLEKPTNKRDNSPSLGKSMNRKHVHKPKGLWHKAVKQSHRRRLSPIRKEDGQPRRLIRKQSMHVYSDEESDATTGLQNAKTMWKKAVKMSKSRLDSTSASHSLEMSENNQSSLSMLKTNSTGDLEKTLKMMKSTPRILFKQPSKMNIRESGGLGIKNIFQKSAKMALQYSKGELTDESGGSSSSSASLSNMSLADTILRGENEDNHSFPKFRMNKVWRIALNKLELVLPAAVTSVNSDNMPLSETDQKMRDALDSLKLEMEGVNIG